ncbi:MAG: 1-acyl-sn-glycerol-3-phosphate acyltransferase [Saprospiraceae bacterium]|nr:MAG: 1-acyl-sn-glycerol-3-phosphate acyltransferase [Saprospiraceae bacterium]
MTFFRKLWATYGILLFFLLWGTLVPFYFLAFLFFPKKWRKSIIWFSHQIYTRILFTLTLIKIKVEGHQHLDPSKTYILVSNHRSSIDFMVNARAYPGVYKFLAKKELVKVPVFGYIVRKMCVLVDRSSPASRAASMACLRDTLAEGYSVFLYPEGTRNKSNAPLLPFHKGAFKIAIESGYPIAIQTIVNAGDVCGKTTSFDLCPGVVRVVWSKPIDVEGMEVKDVHRLSEQVRAEMLKNLSTFE